MKDLPLSTFRHMKICCPYCSGLPTGCEECSETGLCCPTCNGQGRVAKRRQGRVSEVLLCPTCQLDMSDGAQYNEWAASAAIEQYIEDWFAGVIEDPVLTRHKLDDDTRREREEARPKERGLWRHG